MFTVIFRCLWHGKTAAKYSNHKKSQQKETKSLTPATRTTPCNQRTFLLLTYVAPQIPILSTLEAGGSTEAQTWQIFSWQLMITTDHCFTKAPNLRFRGHTKSDTIISVSTSLVINQMKCFSPSSYLSGIYHMKSTCKVSCKGILCLQKYTMPKPKPRLNVTTCAVWSGTCRSHGIVKRDLVLVSKDVARSFWAVH